MNRAQTVRFDFEEEVEVDDTTWIVSEEATARVAYFPAQVSGPPENCYSDESECEIIKVDCMISDGEHEFDITTKPALVQQCMEQLEDRLIGLAWKKWGERDE